MNDSMKVNCELLETLQELQKGLYETCRRPWTQTNNNKGKSKLINQDYQEKWVNEANYDILVDSGKLLMQLFNAKVALERLDADMIARETKVENKNKMKKSCDKKQLIYKCTKCSYKTHSSNGVKVHNSKKHRK